jgi:hypothetical protein
MTGGGVALGCDASLDIRFAFQSISKIKTTTTAQTQISANTARRNALG